MGRTTFDWRWIVVIVLALMFLGQIRLSTTTGLGTVLLALAGYWAIQAGLTPWRGRGSMLGGTKVTYWRGQRIELRQPARSRLRTPATVPLFVSVFYLLLGTGLVLAALSALVRLVAR